MVANCWTCGQPIIFRHIDGKLTPIHVNGNQCEGTKLKRDRDYPFRSADSYVNPNAFCPVCGDQVFFYQSRYGGRVFFDNLGWPWPKHRCTDNSTSSIISPPATRSVIAFKDKYGHQYEVYELDDLLETNSLHIFVFLSKRVFRLRLSFSKASLRAKGIQINDFHDAPPFLIRKDQGAQDAYRVEFISARLKKILRFQMKKQSSAT